MKTKRLLSLLIALFALTSCQSERDRVDRDDEQMRTLVNQLEERLGVVEERESELTLRESEVASREQAVEISVGKVTVNEPNSETVEAATRLRDEERRIQAEEGKRLFVAQERERRKDLILEKAQADYLLTLAQIERSNKIRLEEMEKRKELARLADIKAKQEEEKLEKERSQSQLMAVSTSDDEDQSSSQAGRNDSSSRYSSRPNTYRRQSSSRSYQQRRIYSSSSQSTCPSVSSPSVSGWMR